MLTSIQLGDVAFVVRCAHSTYSTLDCLNLNGAPALFVLRHAVSETKTKNTSFNAGVIALWLYLMSACPIS